MVSLNNKLWLLNANTVWVFIEKKKLEEIVSDKLEKLNKSKNNVSPKKKKKHQNKNKT